MFYWIKTNSILKKILSSYTWEITTKKKAVYLTFDDGPTPSITPWVLSELKKYNAKATFFCIGDNIDKNPEIFMEILSTNHAIGNHTQNHLNGWKTNTKKYIENFYLCENSIKNGQCKKFDSDFVNIHSSIAPLENYSAKHNTTLRQEKLFRPPYGKIKPSQASAIRALGYKIIMWDVLSADFDKDVSKEKCLQNVLENVTQGSIIVFHDSQKAFSNLEYVLPKTLEFLKKNNFDCEVIL